MDPIPRPDFLGGPQWERMYLVLFELDAFRGVVHKGLGTGFVRVGLGGEEG